MVVKDKHISNDLYHVSCNFSLSRDLERATDSLLDQTYHKLLNFDIDLEDTKVTQNDLEINKFVLESSYVNSDGRLVVPALWDYKVLNRLPRNFSLAKGVLKSVFKKYKNDGEKLMQYDRVIREQFEAGVTERVNNPEDYPNASYLAHNAVFKQESLSTKTRVVFLSNLCDKQNPANLSHNQVSLPGCDLNNKLPITATLYRFNKFLFIFDLEKAFLQLCLRPTDTDKFFFLWYDNFCSASRKLVTYRFLRVPFGMRFSPFLLLISLYIILILNGHEENIKLREMLYNLAYMDNLAFSSGSEPELLEAYETSKKIFNEYKFNLQQYATNSKILSQELEESPGEEVKLFGMTWNHNDDTYSVKKLYLNHDATTKRSILSSLNSNFDPLGICLPILNRAKLFMRELQANGNLDWDTKLSREELHEYSLICKQLNKSKTLPLGRFVGNYESVYDMIVCTDASKDFLGCAIYLRCAESGKVSFIMAKNRVISKNSKDTIPVLELLSIKFGLETLFSLRSELKTAFCPIKILKLHCFSDSTISLNWIFAKSAKTLKIERKGCKINNALDKILSLCEESPVEFVHISGIHNPSDVLTRTISSTVLAKSNFLTGPCLVEQLPSLKFSVPGNFGEVTNTLIFSICVTPKSETCIVNFDRYSSFEKLCKVVHLARKFLRCIILRVKNRRSDLFTSSTLLSEENYRDSVNHVIRSAQYLEFEPIFEYFSNPNLPMPSLVQQLNLIVDPCGILRVKSKFGKFDGSYEEKFPILLSKSSTLTACLINDFHFKFMHAGAYKLLSLLRKEFWIPCGLVTVRKQIGKCLKCRKLYGRPVKINQNDYKSVRINPENVPYRDLAIDHAGPFNIKSNSNSCDKAYILIVTCLWSRAVNLIVCPRIDTETFLCAFQAHIFDFGIPRSVLGDNGSPIVSGMGAITKFLSTPDVQNFLKIRNISNLQFTPYPANASYLGGLVESLVKQVKYMIYSSISRNRLSIDHFRFIVHEANMLINKRPLCMKESLADPYSFEFPLTPEKLVKGYDVPCIAIIPQLHSEFGNDSYIGEFSGGNLDVKRWEALATLRKVKANLSEIYYDEFLQNLRKTSTDRPGRYKNSLHTRLNIGDLVAIKQKFTKPYFYPSGIVVETESNDLDEVVTVSIRKGNKEIVRRHVSDVILLLARADNPVEVDPMTDISDPLQCVNQSGEETNVRDKKPRKAAVACLNRLKTII